MLKKGSVELSGKTLTIAKPSQKDETTVDSERATHNEPTTEVIVLGIKQNITTEMLEMFFENEQKSGGGAVKQIRLDEEFGTAVITFESYKGICIKYVFDKTEYIHSCSTYGYKL